MLFFKIANSSFSFAAVWPVVSVLFAASAVTSVIGLLFAKLFRLQPAQAKTFIHTSFHSNISFVGLPILFFALSAEPDSDRLTSIASMAAAAIIPVINIVSMFIMNGQKGSTGIITEIPRMLKRVFLSPGIISCFLGILFSVFSIGVPMAFNRVLEALGHMALPLALMGVGARLDVKNFQNKLGIPLSAAVLNVVILPLIGYLIGRLLDLSRGEMLIALLFLAGPTASSTYIYAREMKGDPVLAGNVILLSTCISICSLFTILYAFAV